MTRFLLRSLAVGLLFIGVFGFAIQTTGNAASPILILIAIILLALSVENNAAN
jgi:hypothetical protein